MKNHRSRPQFELVLMFALATLVVGGCEAPLPIRPLDKAQAAFTAGQWGEAIAACTEAISDNPGDVRSYVLRGRAFRRLGQFQPAITDFTVAIQLMPKDPENYYLRAGVYRDQKEIELADEDDRAGQQLDPSYQQAYLYAPPGLNNDLPAVAAELIRALRDPGTSYTDESSEPTKELYKKPALASDSILRSDPPARSDLKPQSAADALIEMLHTPSLSVRRAADEVEQAPVFQPPPMINPIQPRESAFGAGSGGGIAAPAAPEAPRSLARRNPLGHDLQRPLPGPPAAADQRAARQGRTQRGYAGADPRNFPPQRALNPYGAAAMRSTGTQSDEGALDGGSVSRSQQGSARGGRGGGGYGGPIDPYGGYTGSAKPIGGATYNQYGGGGPYGTGSLNPYGGGQSSASRARPQSQGDFDAGAAGRASANPFPPYPPAPVPLLDPAGLRFN